MMKPFKTFLSTVYIVLLASSARAGGLISFEDIWSRVQTGSPEIQQSSDEVLAAQIAQKRSQRHWLPQATLKGQVFSTNAPGSTLISNLGQRSVTVNDFNPQNLNHPGTSFFQQASVLVDLPVYEGGSRVAATRGLRQMKEAKTLTALGTNRAQFAETAVQYGLLISAINQKNRLSNLHADVNRILKQYELGSSENTVGYSGLLGLESLANRLEGLKVQAEATVNSLKAALAEKAGLGDSRWNPKIQDLSTFLRHLFGKLAPASGDGAAPPQVQAAQLAARAQKNFSEVEKARFLPRLGLFHQFELNNGSRSTATATSSGGYLQWNILSPLEYGSVKQKKLEAMAMEQQARGLALQSRMAANESFQSLKAARNNLNLINKGFHLLEEQTKATENLFRNGTVNVLPLVEILNRRAELLDQLQQTEKQLAMKSAENFVQQSGIHD